MTKIDHILQENTAENAIVLLGQLIEAEPGNAYALYCRGRLYWKLGERAKATSDYAAAASLDPAGPASMALEQARDIENFFNPDLLNP